ncbi:MAG: hypothetical protein Q8M11_15730 [Sulfuritalea sp.]|nr:hypothetical protein [Sulfuritalea sp.]MDP1981509.1 hypothetical protein [Sulfuritalea sp.]
MHYPCDILSLRRRFHCAFISLFDPGQQAHRAAPWCAANFDELRRMAACDAMTHQAGNTGQHNTQLVFAGSAGSRTEGARRVRPTLPRTSLQGTVDERQTSPPT